MGAQLVRPRRGSPRARTRSSLPLGTFLAFVLLSIMLYSVALPVNDSGPPSLLHRQLADKVQSALASLSGGTEKISRELLGTSEVEESVEQGGTTGVKVTAEANAGGLESFLDRGAGAQETKRGDEEKNASAIVGPRNTSHEGRLSVNQNVPRSVREVTEEQSINAPSLAEESQDTQAMPVQNVTTEADCSKESATEVEPEYMANITNYDMLWKQGMWWVPEHPRPTLSIGVLVYKEKESLLAAFETWRKAGLLDYADEVVVYYQLLDEDKLHWLDDFVPLCRGPLRVIGSPNNEALLAATQWVIGNATMDLVLFLEKDWQILETAEATRQRLDDGKMLLEYDIAHVVRYRHRTNPGNPLYCQEIYQGREMEILNNQPNLMCCVHHWLPNAELAAPKYAPYVYKCPALPKLNADNHVIFERNQNDWWCSRAEHCLWTNNPYLLRREWWARHYAPMVEALIDQWDGWTEHQRALDIEYLFGWNPAFWNAKAWTIAVGEGLFTHVERAEHVEVDYKQLRAEADERDRERDRKLEEQKAEQERQETERLRIEAEKRDQQKQAWVNTRAERVGAETETRAAEAEAHAAEARQKLRGETISLGRKIGTHEEGPESADEEAETETEIEEGSGVGESLLLEKPASRLDEEEADVPIHLQKDLPIWELHTQPSEGWVERGRQILDQCTLDAPDDATSAGENPNPAVKGDITLVTALLDLGRGGESNGMFKRGMEEYFARFQRILDRGFPMVVYMPAEFRNHLRIDEARVQVRELTVDGLKDEALFGPYWNAVQLIRTSDLWQRQAAVTGWLDKAPQAVLLGYNPLVMSKPFLLQRAAHENPFGTKYFMFLDAGHACATEITPGQTSLFEEHMDRLFATFWRYASTTEVHGLTDKAMHLYMGQPEDPLKIVRGGILGGRAPVIDCLVDVYRVVLAQTLEDGYMGTEENLLAILYARFPELFHAFDNDSRGTPCDNCAAFSANLERYSGRTQ